MKKKLLSVLMAGVLVASSSVNAFAEGNVTGPDDTTQQTEVTITGDIASNSGDFAPGTLNVTVPTATNFQVNEEGKLTGSSITITNHGSKAVDVVAYEFRDPKIGNGMTIIHQKEMEEKNKPDSQTKAGRTEVYLNIFGNKATAYLRPVTDDEEGKGVYTLEGTVQKDGIKIADVAANGGKQTLQLEGAGGTDGTLSAGVNKEFKLVLKIKKSDEGASS